MEFLHFIENKNRPFIRERVPFKSLMITMEGEGQGTDPGVGLEKNINVSPLLAVIPSFIPLTSILHSIILFSGWSDY